MEGVLHEVSMEGVLHEVSRFHVKELFLSFPAFSYQCPLRHLGRVGKAQ
jgi:hypothetical protein